MKHILDKELATILNIHIGKDMLASSNFITKYTPHNRQYTMIYINSSNNINIIFWDFIKEKGTIMDCNGRLRGYRALVDYLTDTMRRPIVKNPAGINPRLASDEDTIQDFERAILCINREIARRLRTQSEQKEEGYQCQLDLNY